MTERALPQIGVGVRGRPVTAGHVGPVATPRADTLVRPDIARKEAILSTPARAGMLFGVSAAIYAVTLAGISGLQADTDATLAASRVPLQEAVAASRAANDALEAKVAAANARISTLVSSYGTVGGDVTAFQARLDSLAALVADVQGSAAALPARIKLPTVTMRGPVASSGGGSSRAAAPKTTAKSGASGG